jgi:hypothetical protein
MADIYTVIDIQPDIQYQVTIHIHSSRYTRVVEYSQHNRHNTEYTVADTQLWMHSSRSTAADAVVDLPHSRHSGR